MDSLLKEHFEVVPLTQRHRVHMKEEIGKQNEIRFSLTTNLVSVYIVTQGVYECGDILTHLDIVGMYRKCIFSEVALSWSGEESL